MIEEEPTDLDWIQLRQDMGTTHQVETTKDKLIRKVTANPFVPIGVLATTGALSYGLWSMKNGQRKMSQKMMRLRIVAQGFTIAALVIGVMSAGKNIK